ncbi:MAG: MBOAT family protein [Firmicutes bacterium]|nr:MBOAT family protein [Bacillota bacterium]
MFFYLPIFFLLYMLTPRKGKDAVLVAGSLLFYAWGDVASLPVLLCTCLFTGIAGRYAAKSKKAMAIGIAVDLTVLALFKYGSFSAGFPLGISFYMFHAVSYLADVNKRGRPADSFMEYAVYMCMFPKLLMGPIVCFDDFHRQYSDRSCSVEQIADGAFLFTKGLAKKAVLAANMASVCQAVWPDASNSLFSAWLGLLAFGLQLYYDFSGYSDMARGLGWMLGLDLGLNFDHPYSACSISDFWRRWHMSLGGWFKKYLYFPLGGSRKGLWRTLVNLMAVWLATGIWHGNTLNYLLWGLCLGLLICFERVTGFAKRVSPAIGWLWTNFWIFLGWVFFNTEDLSAAISYFSQLFSLQSLRITVTAANAVHDNWYFLLAAVLFSFPVSKYFQQSDAGHTRRLSAVILSVIFLSVSVFFIVNAGYSAFLYTKF